MEQKIVESILSQDWRKGQVLFEEDLLDWSPKLRPHPPTKLTWSFDPELWQVLDHLVDWQTGHQEEVHEYLERSFKSRRDSSYYREAIGFCSEDGEVFQLRYVVNESDPSITRRYDAPSRAGTRIYRPPVPQRFREKIAQRFSSLRADNAGSFWLEVEHDLNLPIYDCEGPAKALTLIGMGYPALCGYGAFGGVKRHEWREFEKPVGRRSHRQKDLTRWEKVEVAPTLPDGLLGLAGKGRRWVLIPDQDINPQTRHKVMSAYFQRGLQLIKQGCDVYLAQWDKSLGKGIDDVHAQHGEAKVEEILANARPLLQVMNEFWMSRPLMMPDVVVSSSSMDKDVDLSAIAQEGLVCTDAGMGTGKTKLMAEITKDRTLLAPYPLRSLAKSAAQTLGASYRNESQSRKGIIYEGDEWSDRITTCIDSLGKIDLTRQFGGELPQDLLLDEVSHLLRHAILGATCRAQRLEICNRLFHLIRGVDRILMSDADLTRTVLDLIKMVRGEDKVQYIRNTFQGSPWQVEMLQHSKVTQAIDYLVEQVDDGLWHWAIDSKNGSYKIQYLLESQGIKSIVINSDTVSDHSNLLVQDVLSSKFDRVLEQKIQVIITSPSVTQGVSWEQDIFRGVIGTFTGCSVTPRQMAQMLGRVRHPVPRYVWASTFPTRRNNKYRNCYKPSDVAQKLFLYGAQEGLMTGGRIDDSEESHLGMRIACELIAEDNREMKNPRETLRALMAVRGHQIREIDTQGISEGLYKNASEAWRNQKLADVLGAENLCAHEASALQEKQRAEGLTEVEQRSMEKWEIAQQFACTPEELNGEMVDLGLKGVAGTPRRRLHAIISDVGMKIAMQIGGQSFNGLLSDVRPEASYAVKLRNLGLPQLIEWLLEGNEIDKETPEIVEFANKVRRHASELGISVSDKLSPVRVVVDVLAIVGLQLICRRKGRNDRVYMLDMERYQILMAANERHEAKFEEPEVQEQQAVERPPLPQPRKSVAKGDPLGFGGFAQKWGKRKTRAG